MPYVLYVIVSDLIQYGAFAAIVAVFFCDFAKVSKAKFFFWTAVCVLYASAVRSLADLFGGSFYSAAVLISVLNSVAAACVALKLLTRVPKSHVVYALAVTLEFACFITGNAVWDVSSFGSSRYDMWLYLLKLAASSAAVCFVVRRFIAPLYKKQQDGRTWLLLSVSPLLGAVGYYVMMNFHGGEYVQLPVTTYICNWILFAALMTANAICVVCVDRSVQAAEDREKLAATNRLLALQKERYSRMADFAQQTKELRHNFRHQAAAMSELLQQGKLDRLKSYLAEYTQELPAADISTGNATADVIFGHYLSLAKQENIDLSYQITLPDRCRISDLDLTVIIGNCMENAIEASAKLPVSERKMRIRSQVNDDFLLLVFENRFDGKLSESNGLFYSSKRGGKEEGFGLATARRAVEQYGGEIVAEHDEKNFYVKLSVSLAE